MVCGVLYAAQGLAVWLSEPPFSLSIPYLDRASNLTIQTLVNVTDVVLLVGALAAVAPLYTLHRGAYGMGGAYGMAGTLFSLAAFVGFALLIVLGLGDVFQGFRSLSSTLLIWGHTLTLLGGVGLGAVTIAVRMLPRWCGVALIVGTLSLEPAALLGELFVTLTGVAWAVVGPNSPQGCGELGLPRIPRTRSSVNSAFPRSHWVGACRTQDGVRWWGRRSLGPRQSGKKGRATGCAVHWLCCDHAKG
jgi:hypothetical protein